MNCGIAAAASPLCRKGKGNYTRRGVCGVISFLAFPPFCDRRFDFKC